MGEPPMNNINAVFPMPAFPDKIRFNWMPFSRIKIGQEFTSQGVLYTKASNSTAYRYIRGRVVEETTFLGSMEVQKWVN